EGSLRLRVLREAQARDLAPLDLRSEVAQRCRVEPQPQAFCRLPEHPALALKDARHRAADHLRPEVAQLGEGGRVEGAGRDASRPEPSEAGAQLPRRLGREGERHDPVGGIDTGCDAIGDPVGDRGRLSGSRTREHADGAVGRLRRLALFLIEVREQGIRARWLVHRALPTAVPSTISPPYQCSMMARAIETRPGRMMSPSDAASSSRLNQRSSRISSPSGVSRDSREASTRAVNPSMSDAGKGQGCEPRYSKSVTQSPLSSSTSRSTAPSSDSPGSTKP